jgi:hypothetical protein
MDMMLEAQDAQDIPSTGYDSFTVATGIFFTNLKQF